MESFRNKALIWWKHVSLILEPYLGSGPLAAFFLGISSGFPFALIGATLTTRLAQDGISKSSVTAFALTFLAYNFKPLWAPIVDNTSLPFLAKYGQRRSWLWFVSLLLICAIVALGIADPSQALTMVAISALAVGLFGATLDIIIVGSGMSQYGWRIGAASAGAFALLIAQNYGWSVAYIASIIFVLPAVFVGVIFGEPVRNIERSDTVTRFQGLFEYFSPLLEFVRRQGAWLVLFFILIHKVGDTLANLTLRLLFDDLGFTNEEIAFYDVGFGFIAFLLGIFLGGLLFSGLGMKRSVFISLVLMAVSNFSFAALALVGKSNLGMAAAVGFENFASGIGGVTVVAYLSALCNLRFTATQYALLSALASIAGRVLTGTLAGGLIVEVGYVSFYLLTTIMAVPGVLLFWYMIQKGLADLKPEGESKF